MSGTRAEVVAGLRTIVPETFRVLDEPRKFDWPSAAVKAVLVVERTTVEPGPSQGTLTETHTVHVCVPSRDDKVIDDQLDEALDKVLEALVPLDTVEFVNATRSQFDESYHSWQVSIRLTATVTPKE